MRGGARLGAGRKKADPAQVAARNRRRAHELLEAADAAQGVERPKEKLRLRLRDFAGIAERYAHDVMSGTILAGRHVRLACERHLRDLSRQATEAYPYRFDHGTANNFCALAERYPHIKGRWARQGERLHLEPWQCFVLCVPFGWKRKHDGRRRFRKIYLEVPRKNAKSTLAAAIGNNMLLADGEHGAEVYSGATSEKQAWEVFGPARLMLERTPELKKVFGAEVWAKAIVKPADNSKFWPIIGKPGDGASPSCSIHDEYHEQESPDQVDTMQTGMGSREQPMLVIITTSGTNLASPCHDEHLAAKKVLEGVLEDDELFAIIYSIDEGDDWVDPKILIKANPNMNVSVDEEFLRAQQRNAVLNPAHQNRFKTKHLNIWCAASVAGINMHAWKLATDLGLRLEEFAGQESFGALDLASKIDICSYMKLFRKRINGQNHYYAFGRHYLPEDTIEEAKANQQAYRKWVAQGRLIATDGAEIDFDLIREDVKVDASQFQFKEIVYDPWRATQLAHQLARDGATVVEMAQTAKHMGEAFDELNAALKGGRFHHDGDPVLEWMASNVIARSVMKGLTVPGKDKPAQKIDGIVALVMAIARALATDPGGGMSDWLKDPVMVA